MISVLNASKSFGDVKAINHISLNIADNSVFGLLGTNGAGKSTLLRMMSGVLKPDEGRILVDEKEVYDNPETKANIFYISDDQYFFPNATPKDVAEFYQSLYSDFQMERFNEFLEKFDLKRDRKIRTFSKGMKKQLSILLGVCANTKYIFCDETFDGLDPVVRQGTKSIFIQEMEERGLTPIIASHNLRELEDICDQVGVLHEGGVLLAKDLEDLKLNVCKVQCVFPEDAKILEDVKVEENATVSEDVKVEENATVSEDVKVEENATVPETFKDYFSREFDLVKFEQRGRLISMIVRASAEEVTAKLEAMSPVYCEVMPLTLEEIFISETEVAGYDFKKLLL